MLMNILQQLEKWDQWLFTKLNSDWTNPFFDSLFPFLRNEYYWAPLYLFLVVFVTVNFGVKGWWWILFFLCTFALTDLISSRLIKETVDRLRPCNDPDMMMQVRLLLPACGGGKSFTSSHATNHFGMAAFFFVTFRRLLPRYAWVGFAWAGAIVYSQVYVGVHYPLDVICGALLGTFIGAVTGCLFNKRYGFATFGKESTMS